MSSNTDTLAYLGPVFNSLYAYDGRKLASDYELLREYATNDIVYACVNYNANALANLKFRLYTSGSRKAIRSHQCRRVTNTTRDRLRKNRNLVKMIGPGDDVTEITEHPLLDLLYNDNDGLDGYQFFLMTQTYQEIMGRSYWRVEGGAVTGRPSSLYMLKPQRTQPKRNGDGDVIEYVNQPDLRGQWDTLDLEEVIDFRFPHPEDPYGWGMSPLKACYLQSLLTSKFTQFGNSLMDNRARIDGMFLPADDVGPEMARKAEEQFQQRFGQGRNGGVWFSPTRGTFVPTKYSPTDLGPMEVDKNTTSRVCRAFGIPEPLMSANESTFSNMDKALQFHAKFTTQPRALMMEQRLNVRLVPLFDDRLFLAADNPVPEDNEFELKKVQIAMDGQALTKNEIREMAGYEPMVGEGLDDLPAEETPDQRDGEDSADDAPKTPEKPAKDEGEDTTKAITFDVGKIIEINKAVADGNMPRAVAISTVAKAFEMTEEEARGLVGYAKVEPIVKTPGPHKFASTQVNLPPEVAGPMLAMANAIPADELAGDGIETEPHVTLKYGLHSDDPAEVVAALAGEPRISLSLGECTLFEANEARPYDVLKIDVDSPDMVRLFEKIKASVPNTEKWPEYHPHATIAYLKPGMGKKYIGASAVTGQAVKVSDVVFSARDGKRSVIPLASEPPPAPEVSAPEVEKSITKAIPGVAPANHPELASKLKTYFNDQRTEALSYAGNVPDEEKTKRDRDLAALLLLLGLSWAKESGSEALTKIDAPARAEKAFTEAIPAEAQKAAKFYAEKINETTYKRMQSAIDAMRDEAQPEAEAPAAPSPEIAPAQTAEGPASVDPTSAINEVFDAAVEKRSDSIAEDQSYKFRVLGQYVAGKNSTTVEQKVWIAYPGCCEVCAEMSGQVIPIDQQFKTQLGEVLYPGAVHTHCRCRLGYVLDDGSIYQL